jgi:hypothetical protein
MANKFSAFKRGATQKLARLKLPAQKFFQELVLLCGLVLICVGIARFSTALGLIAAGVFLTVLSIVKPKKESKG